MKILWVGDAVTPTGFARCTHAACDALHAAGHEVTVIGINYYGSPEAKEFPYEIYAPFAPPDGARDQWGIQMLPIVMDRTDPDVIIILQDAWNIPGYTDTLQASRRHEEDCDLREGGDARCSCSTGELPPIVGWIAVDAMNQPGEVLNSLDHVITWTEFGQDQITEGGYEGRTSIVPLGADMDTFRPYDQAEARKRFLPDPIPQDAFIVGVVGRNQPRKRIDLTIAYFADWVNSHDRDDAWLYCHVAPTGERGFDLIRLAKYHGVSDRLILSTPHTAQGMPTDALPQIYSMFDLYLSTSAGEGWGLPALEAMACGVPCVLPDYAAWGEWAKDAALLVPCTGTQVNAPINAKAYTIGGVPDRQACVWALAALYSDHGLRERHREAGLTLAKKFTWERTGREFVDVIERVAAPRKRRLKAV